MGHASDTFDQHCHHTQDAVGPTTSTQDAVGPTTSQDAAGPTTSTQDVVGPTTSCGRSHTDGTFLSLCVFK